MMYSFRNSWSDHQISTGRTSYEWTRLPQQSQLHRFLEVFDNIFDALSSLFSFFPLYIVRIWTLRIWITTLSGIQITKVCLNFKQVQYSDPPSSDPSSVLPHTLWCKTRVKRLHWWDLKSKHLNNRSVSEVECWISPC